MTEYRITVAGEEAEPLDGWQVEWLDADRRTARLTDGSRSVLCTVDGAGGEWWVAIGGRRLPVAVRTRREQILAEAAVAGAGHGGPIEVKATLPGLVVAVTAAVGQRVAQGDALLTVEAMKMQNEVRAPRDGLVAEIAVAAGQAVATGAVLLRLE